MSGTEINNLKPCPFCGSDAKIEKTKRGSFSIYCINYQSHCPASAICLARKGKQDVIDKWNRRNKDTSKIKQGGIKCIKN